MFISMKLIERFWMERWKFCEECRNSRSNLGWKHFGEDHLVQFGLHFAHLNLEIGLLSHRIVFESRGFEARIRQFVLEFRDRVLQVLNLGKARFRLVGKRKKGLRLIKKKKFPKQKNRELHFRFGIFEITLKIFKNEICFCFHEIFENDFLFKVINNDSMHKKFH